MRTSTSGSSARSIPRGANLCGQGTSWACEERICSLRYAVSSADSQVGVCLYVSGTGSSESWQRRAASRSALVHVQRGLRTNRGSGGLRCERPDPG